MDSKESRELKMSRTVKAPIELVWKVWTDPEHIANWWGPNGHTNTIHQMDFREGGEWRLTMHGPDGRNYPNRSIFKEIIPLKKIVFEHFNPHFIATIIFEPKGEETEIEWRSLFDTTEMLETVVKTFNAKEGQKQNFEKLGNYLLQIIKREPIIIERTFDAPIQSVWEAITNADALRQWFFDVSIFEARVGFEFGFQGKGKDGEDFLHQCVVTEVKEPNKLSYSWRYEGVPGISHVFYELRPEGNKTKIRLTHTGLETFPADNAFAKSNFMEGWTTLIGALLRDYVEIKLKSSPKGEGFSPRRRH